MQSEDLRAAFVYKARLFQGGPIEMNQIVHHWLLRAIMFSLAAGAPGLSPSIRITGGIRSAELA